jgi:hypothetical protein
MQNNFEIKRMMSHLVLKLCITTLKVIYCYASVYCKYKSLLVVPKIPRDGFSYFRSGGWINIRGVLLLALAAVWWQRPERPRKKFNKICFLGLHGEI